MKPIPALLLAFLLASNSYACRIYVKTDGLPFTKISDHNSWAVATSELQTAIDSLYAVGGGEVWVASGTYYPTLTDDPEISFYPRNNVVLYGGFEGTETSIDERQLSDIDTNGVVEPWEFTHQTILSGELSDPCHIVNGKGTDSTAILDGLTIKSSYIPNLFWLKSISLTKKSRSDSIHRFPFDEESIENWTDNQPTDKQFSKDNFFFLSAKGEYAIPEIDTVGIMDPRTNTEVGIGTINVELTGTGAYGAFLRNCIISNTDGNSIIDSCQLEHCCLLYNSVGWVGTVENSVLDHCAIKLNRCTMTGVGAVNSVLTDCILADNFASNGTLCTGSTLHNCIISENFMEDGHVFYSCMLVNCNVLNNSSHDHPAFFEGGFIMDCKFINNRSTFDFISSSSVSNTEFISNSCGDYGFLTNTTLSNCILANNFYMGLTINSMLCNSTITGNRSLYFNHNSSLYNCIVWRNEMLTPITPNASIFFCAVDESIEGEGNIVLDSLNETGPRFINPSTLIGQATTPEELEEILNADWSLQQTSPCIDKGSIEYYVLVPKIDAKGNPRLKGSTLDMGALECQTGDFPGFGLHPDEKGILYIKENGIGDGSSWEQAAGDISLAIAATDFEDVSQIWVAGGMYHPTKSNQRGLSFVLRNRIPLYGGFNGNETSVQERSRIDSDTNGIIEPWEFEYPSILSGNIGDPEDSLDNSYVIIYKLYSDSISIVDGYTITDGYSNEWINYTSNIGYFKNCVISNNFYYGPGGGAGNSLLWHCLLKGNKAYSSGGAWASSLYDCVIEDNYAQRYGGGVSDCKLSNCVLINNSSRAYGGGAHSSDLTGCLVIGNESSNGGGIHNCRIDNSYLINNKSLGSIGGACYSNLKNCLVGFNTATDQGGGASLSNLLNCTVIRNRANSVGGIYGGTAANCILWGNSASPGYPQQVKNSSLITYSGIQGGYAGTGNIGLDSLNEQGPRFMNPTDSLPDFTSYEELKQILNSNWSLQSTSPCVNMGSNNLYDGPERDLAWNKRIICGIIDMGAYESKRSLPAFGINYIEEETNGPIPSFVAYNTLNDFTGSELYGEELPVPLYPGPASKYLFFRVTDSDTTEYGLDSLYIPSRPADPAVSINYPEETVSGVAPNTYWNATGDYMQLQNEQRITEYIPEAGNSENLVEVRIESTETSFSALNPQVLAIDSRPYLPVVEIDYPNEQITGVEPNTIWDISGDFAELSEGEPLTPYIPSFAEDDIQTHIAFRATDTSFWSRYRLLIIPARPSSPEVNIDYVNEWLTGVEENMYWNSSGGFNPVSEEESMTDLIPDFGWAPDTIQMIYAATHDNFRSEEQSLVIPSRPALPTNPDVNDEEDTFGWDYPGREYESPADFEFNLGDHAFWSECPGNPLFIGNLDLPAGFVQIRLRASNETGKERFHSETLFSDEPFTQVTALYPVDDMNIQVYPTVTDGLVYCYLPDEEEYTLEVYNSNGMSALTMKNSSNIAILDFSLLQAGVYILKIGDIKRRNTVFRIIRL